MRENIEATKGLVMAEAVTMALGARIGRDEAHHVVEAACRRAVEEEAHLRDVLGCDPAVTGQLTADQLDRLFRADGYLGVAEELVRRALDRRRRDGGRV
jgi:3-carboxy-cis,cis-muconate cycloisomerase